MDKCRKDIKDANYAELMSGRAQKAEAEGRDKMVRTTEKAVAGTTKLEQGLAVLAETEEIGVSVIDNMTQQREQLIRTRDKASDINTLAEQAKGIVRGIQARAITNKVILGACGGAVAAAAAAQPPCRASTYAHTPASPLFYQARSSFCYSARLAAWWPICTWQYADILETVLAPASTQLPPPRTSSHTLRSVIKPKGSKG